MHTTEEPSYPALPQIKTAPWNYATIVMRAIVYDPHDVVWYVYEAPKELLIANDPDEVPALLDRVEEYSSDGDHAFGYVSYEAAPAFDSALQVNRGEMPVATFGIFASREPYQIPVVSESQVIMFAGLSQTAYQDAIAEIKQKLAAGESYQVNFTHQLTGEISGDFESLFFTLVGAQESTYASYIEFEDQVICSISPELFFELNGDDIRTEPMKGTRPRGRFLEEDQRIKVDLAGSMKDRAENLMIVDMIRNDLSRIALPGSVVADHLFELRQLPTVWQQVSTVKAKTNAGLREIFTAMFPCASVTGAPKAATMSIIKTLESAPRGLYTGAIGWVGPGRQMRFGVAIRTLLIDKQNRAAGYGVGGGIVWDSDAAEEWQESLTKADVLMYRQPAFQLLETMRYDNQQGVHQATYHLDRMRASADYFGFQFPATRLADELSGYHNTANKKLRLLLSADGCYELEVSDLPPVQEVVRLIYAKEPVQSSNRFLFHKTTHRVVYEVASQNKGKFDDVLLFNERGEITETTIYNIFVELDGELLTPAQECGLLAGTYRRKMLAEGLAKPAVISKQDLQRATRLFVANSVRRLVLATLESEI